MAFSAKTGGNAVSKNEDADADADANARYASQSPVQRLKP